MKHSLCLKSQDNLFLVAFIFKICKVQLRIPAKAGTKCPIGVMNEPVVGSYKASSSRWILLVPGAVGFETTKTTMVQSGRKGSICLVWGSSVWMKGQPEVKH
ncbi:hypothetical protein ILYODFUR_028463 [Ilyodon furcidens]|uniref:Uncharacterized protein n=1 Tax=Ilyodon furcidens TaxID=33524 RepID=A0ABV0UBZ1_9TELE